jgi:hypothetical protein
MSFRPKLSSRSAVHCALILSIFAATLFSSHSTVSAQDGLGFKVRVGGSYDELDSEQQVLVRKWHEEYEKVTGNKIDPKVSYDNLNLSVRTTFEAVTNALLRTNLTDSDGKSLGNALGIVKLVESVHGQIPQTRGDEQFRIYVLLQPDALDKLYKSVQFRRTGDNSVYHIGYPVNFRQLGGAPSIQVSVTRTGLRADIDVDYRSSGGPQALINGHLTAGNSDVRAGGNYTKHVKRWNGFNNWWQSLFGLTPMIPKSDLAALSSQYRKPDVRDSQPVQAAVLDFYKNWLVDGKPQMALSYLSVKANACIAQFNTNETAGDSLIRLRFYEHMRKARLQLAATDPDGSNGTISKLDEVLRGTVMLAPGAKPIDQSNGGLFSIANIPDNVARALDCRKMQNLVLAQDLPRATNKLADYYSSSSILRAKNDSGAGQVLYLVWHREEGTWKIVSWHLDNPTENAIGPELLEGQDSGTDNSGSNSSNSKTGAADPALAAATQHFLQNWMLTRDTAATLKSVAPEALPCGPLDEDVKKKPTPAVQQAATQKWFKDVAKDIPKKETLTGTIQRVDFNHPHMQEVTHANPNAYLLVRVSDSLASMSNCNFRVSGAKLTPADAMGKAFYTLNIYQTMFQPRHKTGDRGTVVLTWARRQKRWMVIAYDVMTY